MPKRRGTITLRPDPKATGDTFIRELVIPFNPPMTLKPGQVCVIELEMEKRDGE